LKSLKMSDFLKIKRDPILQNIFQKSRTSEYT
jgi:hypothetical protein